MPTREMLREDVFSGELVALGIALVLVLVSRLLLPPREKRLTRQPIAFLVLHVALLAAVRLWPGESRLHRGATLLAVAFLLAALGRIFVVFVLDVILGRRMARPLPKIIRDLSQAVVYLLVLLGALRALDADLGSLLTTSALITAVVGLSLQETLGNLFAGLAIQMQHPFDVGDWIQFDADPNHVGRVLEISWRATKVLTGDDVEVIVPNGALGKAPIANFSKPTPRSRRFIYVTLPSNAAPRRAQKLIADAVEGAFGVLAKPALTVVTHAFAETGIEYCVCFYTDQFHKREEVDGGVRDRIFYALEREQIPLATPARDVFLHEDLPKARARSERKGAEERLAKLRGVDFLAVLPEEDLARIASAARENFHPRGETILRIGDPTSALYIVNAGAARVLVPGEGGELEEVATLAPGQFFGEMALMTGEPRNATVVAAEDTELFVIGSDDVKAVLASHGELAETVSRVLAERQAKLDERAASATSGDGDDVSQRTTKILGKVRRFFALSTLA